MKDVPQIEAAYRWMIAKYQVDATAANSANDQAALDRLDAYRDTLERGVVVLLFGQFEVELNRLFEIRRDAKQSNPDWSVRRGWDTPDLLGRKTSSVKFETRLALMLDRNIKEFGKIMKIYALRNHCAHGRMTQPVGAINLIVQDLYNWQSLLRSE